MFCDPISLNRKKIALLREHFLRKTFFLSFFPVMSSSERGRGQKNNRGQQKLLITHCGPREKCHAYRNEPKPKPVLFCEITYPEKKQIQSELQNLRLNGEYLI